MESERRLIERARSDEQAFLELYTHYYPKLFGYLLVQTRQKELAEDIAQDTFLKAIQGLKQYEYRGASFGAWLFTIAKNTLASHYRKQNRVHIAEPEELELVGPIVPSSHEALVGAEDEQVIKEKLRVLEQGMQKLSEQERELVSMKYIADLSYDDIAKVFKKRPTTLAVQMHRILKKLRGMTQ
ncbi:MAG: RNA polymerase sigma factor [bacterium]|nr:RNA polymerase sigma factor [bacterium]